MPINAPITQTEGRGVHNFTDARGDMNQVLGVDKTADKWLVSVKSPLGTKVFEIPLSRAADEREATTQVEYLMKNNAKLDVALAEMDALVGAVADVGRKVDAWSPTEKKARKEAFIKKRQERIKKWKAELKELGEEGPGSDNYSIKTLKQNIKEAEQEITESGGKLDEAKQDNSSDYPMEVHYVEGMKSTNKTKRFKTEAEFDRWYEQNQGNIEIKGTRKADAEEAKNEK